MTVETVTHARRAVADEGFVEDLVDPDHDRDDTGDARRYDAWFESPWGRYAWAVESRLVHAALEGSGGRLVLDVGCGTGRSSALLRSSGVHVVGIDPDAGMLGLARARVDSAILAGGVPRPRVRHDGRSDRARIRP